MARVIPIRLSQNKSRKWSKIKKNMIKWQLRVLDLFIKLYNQVTKVYYPGIEWIATFNIEKLVRLVGSLETNTTYSKIVQLTLRENLFIKEKMLNKKSKKWTLIFSVCKETESTPSWIAIFHARIPFKKAILWSLNSLIFHELTPK